MISITETQQINLTPQTEINQILTTIGYQDGDLITVRAAKGEKTKVFSIKFFGGCHVLYECFFKGKDSHGNNEYDFLSKIVDFDCLTKLANDGYDIFFIPAIANKKKIALTAENITGSNCVYFEIDPTKEEIEQKGINKVLEDTLTFINDKCSELGIIPSLIIYSGNKSYHVYFRVNDLTVSQFVSIKKHLAKIFGGDPAVSNANRQMRLPGFWRFKDGKRKPVNIIFKSDASYTCNDFKSKLNQVLKIEETKPVRANDNLENIAYPDDLVEKIVNYYFRENPLPERIPGHGTYKTWLKIANCFGHLLGFDSAIDLISNHSPKWHNLRQCLTGSLKTKKYSLPAIIKIIKEDFEIELPKELFAELMGTISDSEVKKQENIEKWLQSRKFTPTITLNCNYLSGDLLTEALEGIDLESKHIAIKSPLGTNKTGAMISYLSKKIPNHLGIILLSDINRLLIQSVDRFNQEIGDNHGKMYHLHNDQAYDFIIDDQAKLSLCFQSLMRFCRESFESKILVIDEPISVIKSFLDGDTLKNYPTMQSDISMMLRRLFSEAITIFSLDGNMTDRYCNLISELSGKETIKIEGKPINPRLFEFKEWQAKNVMLSQLSDDILAGKQISFTSDNQSELRRVYEVIKSKVPPELLPYIVDSDSTKDEAPEALLTKPSEYLLTTKRSLFYSPAMNRGFDISGDIFSDLYCLFTGILGIDGIDQQSFRIRSQATKRHICIYQDLKNIRHNSFFENQLAEVGRKLILSSQLLKHKTANDLGEVTQEITTAFFNDPFIKYEQGMREIEKIEQNDFKKFLTLFWEQKGIRIVSDQSGIDCQTMDKSEKIQSDLRTAGQSIKETKEAKRLDRAAAVVNAEATDNSKKYDIAKKDFLMTNYPSLVGDDSFTPENLVKIEDQFLLQKWTKFFYLSDLSIPIAELEKEFYRIIKTFREKGIAWIRDFKSEALQIWGLSRLGLLDFVYDFKDREFSGNDPDLLKLLRRAGKKKIRELTGISLSLGQNIKSLNRLLNQIGLKAVFVKKKNETRFFKIVPAIGDWDLIDGILKDIAIKSKSDLVRIENLSEKLKTSDPIQGAVFSCQQPSNPDISSDTARADHPILYIKQDDLPGTQTHIESKVEAVLEEKFFSDDLSQDLGTKIDVLDSETIAKTEGGDRTETAEVLPPIKKTEGGDQSDHLSDREKISFLGTELTIGAKYIVRLFNQLKEAVFIGIDKSLFGDPVAEFIPEGCRSSFEIYKTTDILTG